jgi:hypothetical protein
VSQRESGGPEEGNLTSARDACAAFIDLILGHKIAFGNYKRSLTRGE